MARPTVGAVAEWLYDVLEPLAKEDGEETGWSLLHWCEGFGRLLDELNLIVRTGPDGKVGWAALVDPDAATESTIAFAGQLLGMRFDPNLSLAVKKNKLRDAAGIYAGTPSSIAGEVHNIGATNVLVFERSETNYSFAVGAALTDLAAMQSIQSESFESGVGAFIDDTTPPSMVSSSTRAFVGSKSLKWVTGDSSDGIHTTTAMNIPAGTAFKVSCRIWPATDPAIHPSLSFIIQQNGGAEYFEYPIGLLPNYMDQWSWGMTTSEEAEEAITRAVALQKPIGMSFSVQTFIDSDWTWFIIGSTRYTRNADGFMEITPSPYPTWQDVVDNFATWQDFIDNNPTP
jgi:hypothetical protein